MPTVFETATARSKACWHASRTFQYCIRDCSLFDVVPVRSTALLPGSLPAAASEISSSLLLMFVMFAQSELFTAFGEVIDVHVVTDGESGHSKGFTFVEMSTDEAAKNAIAGLDETPLGDGTLTVSEARPRPERSSGYGYGSGREYERRPRRDDRSSY
jgi:hypothetical protein